MFEQAFVNYNKDFLTKKYVTGKLLLVMAYLRLYASYSGKITLCIDYMAEKMGYVPNRKPGKINDSIATGLEWLKNQDYIDYDLDVSNAKNHSECFICKINEGNNIFDVSGEDGVSRPFVQLTEEEFEKIISSPFKRKDWLLSIYLHMKKRICINGVGKDAAYCFASLDTITRDVNKNVNISRTSVSNVISELVRMGLLYEHITGAYVDCHGKVRSAVNFYTIDETLMNHAECDNLAKIYLEEQEGISIEKFIK